MKTLLKIFTNPVGIAITIVHWIIVIFAFLTQENLFGRNVCFHCDYTLFNWLVNLNSPSFLIIELAAVPMHLLSGKNVFIEILFAFVLIFLITFQWFLIGFFVNRIINVFKSEEIKLSLK